MSRMRCFISINISMMMNMSVFSMDILMIVFRINNEILRKWSTHAEQSPRSCPQPGIQRTQSPANASLAVGDEAPGSSSPYSGALDASRTAAPRTEEASCIRPPEVPPTRYGESPLVQARQCGTMHSLRPRIREKSSVYG
jgi:hypothetical protein